MSTLNTLPRAAEAVGRNHPDKQADYYSDTTLDYLMDGASALKFDVRQVRCAAEVMINGAHIMVGGEFKAPVGVYDPAKLEERLRAAYLELGNDPRDNLKVTLDLRAQSSEIAFMTDVGAEGAGDQGIMRGHADRRTKSRLPLETELAWSLIRAMHDRVTDGTLSWGREDTKAQVCVTPEGKVTSVIMSVQHRDWIPLPDLRNQLFEHVVVPTLGHIERGLCKLNHKGSFVEGGADADCGLTGRKIVVDAYGPSVPVGGGAFSGKDPTKVDRSAAYAARQMALTVLDQHSAGGTVCDVAIAYGIGQHQPEILTAVIDGTRDVSDWLRQRFPDNSPAAIQERLGLWDRDGWRYANTSSFGHFGRDLFPWERPFLE